MLNNRIVVARECHNTPDSGNTSGYTMKDGTDMYIEVLVKYRRKLGPAGSGGDWDGDTATTHRSDGGDAWCRAGRPDAPRSGVSVRGWERLRRFPSDVTCTKCRRSLDLPPLED